MVIKSLELKNFRNLCDANIVFNEGTNILYGDNAQGKTNVLESIYVSGTTKSHRGAADREMIRFGKEEAHIRTIVRKNESDRRIDIHLKKNDSKGVALSGIPIRKAGDIFGILNLIIFSPEDLNIIKRGPSNRRHFIDMEISQLDRMYLHDLADYNKVLKQRNKLLKDIYYQPSLEETLCVWDDQLIKYGERIIKSREEFIEELNDIVCGIHMSISGGREKLEVKYEYDTGCGNLSYAVMNGRERDIKTGITGSGPHRDDMSFIVNGIDIRKFGSQGQQRTAALSLKMAEIEMVKRKTGDIPVLLLDDVLSELDSSRQNFLLKNIKGIQTVITCTGLDEFIKNRFNVDKVFYVKRGNVTVR